jgi:predicted DsbA family dithiol-disulfide isomerase
MAREVHHGSGTSTSEAMLRNAFTSLELLALQTQGMSFMRGPATTGMSASIQPGSKETTMSAVNVTYFSDILCIWAYVAQARVEAIKQAFGNQVQLNYRFCSVFGDTRTKIGLNWEGKGGFDGYSKHVKTIAARFRHVKVHPLIWAAAQPPSSASPHLFLAAVHEWEIAAGADASQKPIFESVMWAFRRGFFELGFDIADWNIQCELARPFGVDIDAVERGIHNGAAFARLAADYQDAETMHIEGSPTFVLNEGRQKLFGNVGFRIVEANIREVLREPNMDQASWC